MGFWNKARSADSNYSLASWGWTSAQWMFPSTVGGLVTWAAAYRDWIWNDYGMLGVLLIGIGAAFVASAAIALTGIAFRAFSFRNPKETQSTKKQPTEKITGKIFRNERVSLDYKYYLHCEFYNVTLVYNGTEGGLSHCTFHGSPHLITDTPEIEIFVRAMHNLGLLNASALEDGRVVEPSNPILNQKNRKGARNEDKSA